MRTPDCRGQKPGLGGLARDIAGFGFAQTGDKLGNLISSYWTEGVTQEVFMSWHRVLASWKQVKDQVVFRGDRLRLENRNGVDSIGPEASRGSQSSDRQTAALRPDDQVRRSEFSLHIGC
jgi:hypothetical protein